MYQPNSNDLLRLLSFSQHVLISCQKKLKTRDVLVRGWLPIAAGVTHREAEARRMDMYAREGTILAGEKCAIP